MIFLGVLLTSYLIGSIPFGLLLVKLKTGKDIRKVGSGRIGATNAMRAAGFGVGFMTLILDILKGASTVWIADAIAPEFVWLKVLAPISAILGHNYSVFLLESIEGGRLRLRGGAGGATCMGGSLGLWAPSLLITIPLGGLVLFGLGYASIGTMSVALLSILVFTYRATISASPWEFVVYGLLAEIILVWSLRTNIQRLISGNERRISWRVRQSKKAEFDS